MKLIGYNIYIDEKTMKFKRKPVVLEVSHDFSYLDINNNQGDKWCNKHLAPLQSDGTCPSSN